MGDGGYQVVRMLIISFRHFRATRAALRSGSKYIDTSENSDALGLGIKLQARSFFEPLQGSEMNLAQPLILTAQSTIVIIKCCADM
jgi:saccharopine dehydrogenase-like NADP-dependent oxidoreductase